LHGRADGCMGGARGEGGKKRGRDRLGMLGCVLRPRGGVDGGKEGGWWWEGGRGGVTLLSASEDSF
jgi:hypothetical protein